MGNAISPAVSADVTVASPAPAGSQAESAPSPGAQQGSGTPSPGVAPESPNMRQLREAYEGLKKQYEPYEKLGKAEEIQGQVSVYQKLATRALEIGTELGYDESQIRDALAEDPDGTIAFLRNKQSEAEKNSGQPPDIKKLLKEELSKELKPFYQEREQQAIEKAHALFDTAFDAQISELFKDEKLSSDELDFLYDSAFYLLERDPAIVKQIKAGQASGVAKLVATAKTAFDKAYLARNTRETERIGGPKPATGEKPGEKKFTIDDIIQGNFPESIKFPNSA